jgi:hypothetical protein
MAPSQFSPDPPRFLYSQKLAIGLFALFICILLPCVFPQLVTALAISISIMMAMLFPVLALCTLRKWRSLRASTLVIHLGSVVAIVGANVLANLGSAQ